MFQRGYLALIWEAHGGLVGAYSADPTEATRVGHHGREADPGHGEPGERGWAPVAGIQRMKPFGELNRAWP